MSYLATRRVPVPLRSRIRSRKRWPQAQVEAFLADFIEFASAAAARYFQANAPQHVGHSERAAREAGWLRQVHVETHRGRASRAQ